MKDNLPLEPEQVPDTQEIIITVKDGVVTGVTINGEAVPAIIHDYDVQFPVALHTVEQDEDGDYYTPMVIK